MESNRAFLPVCSARFHLAAELPNSPGSEDGLCNVSPQLTGSGDALYDLQSICSEAAADLCSPPPASLCFCSSYHSLIMCRDSGANGAAATATAAV